MMKRPRQAEPAALQSVQRVLDAVLRIGVERLLGLFVKQQDQDVERFTGVYWSLDAELDGRGELPAASYRLRDPV